MVREEPGAARVRQESLGTVPPRGSCSVVMETGAGRSGAGEGAGRQMGGRPQKKSWGCSVLGARLWKGMHFVYVSYSLHCDRFFFFFNESPRRCSDVLFKNGVKWGASAGPSWQEQVNRVMGAGATASATAACV